MYQRHSLKGRIYCLIISLAFSFFISLAGLGQGPERLHKFSSGMVYSFIKRSPAPNKQEYLKKASGVANPQLTAGDQIVSPGVITLTVNYTGTTCGYSNGSFDASASGGNPPYLFSENGYPQQNSGYFGQKAAGTYVITVTDANGLTNQATVTLTNTYAPFNVRMTPITTPGCTAMDGSVSLSVIGGTAPFQYGLNGETWQSSSVLSNLRPGSYNFAVEDANGCRAGDYEYFFGYLCGIQGYSYSELICHPNTGEISISVPRGSTSFSFSLDNVNYQSSPDFTGLPIGNYTVYVRNAGIIVSIFSLHIGIYCSISVTALTRDATCGNHDGTITATGGDGIPPYSYSLDGTNFQTGGLFSGLAPGTYTVTVKDINGSINTTDAIIYDGCPTAAAVPGYAICGQSNGSIKVTASGGSAPYMYSIDGIHFQGSDVFSGLAANTYTVTVKDANGFSAVTSCTVSNACVIVTATATDGSCDNNKGSILAAGSGGTLPYKYSLDGISFQPSAKFTDLKPGSYTVTIQDAEAISGTATVSVGNKPGPTLTGTSVSPASCANNDGKITISATGSQSPLTYTIDGSSFQASPAFTDLPSGSYLASIKDANGCAASAPVTIPMQNTITANAGTATPVCEGSSVTLSASTNGNSFSWQPDPTLSDIHSLNPVVKPSVTTTYYFTGVSGSCTAASFVTVTVNPAPVANAGIDASTCYGKDISLNGSGGVSYQWTPTLYLSDSHIGDPVMTRPLQSMTYSLTVTDDNGCMSLTPATVRITVTPPADVFAGNDTSISVNQPLSLHATDVNGSGFFDYQWSPAYGLDNAYVADPVAIIDKTTVYTVKAATPNGCFGLGQINVKVYQYADIYVPNAFSPNADGHNDVLRTIPVGIKEFKYFIVYNRWGQQVFQSSDPAKGWDGKFKGQYQTGNVFVWMAAGVDYTGKAIQKKGTVLLIR